MFKHFALHYLKPLTHRYNLLLLSLVLLFVFRPYNANPFYLGIWKLLLTTAILAAIFNCKHSKKIKITEVFLAIPAILFSWVVLWTRLPWASIVTSTLSILFTFLCTASIIHDVLVRKKASFNMLKGVICAYLLVGIGFAHFFWLLEFLHPGTFVITYKTISISSFAEYFSEMLYFSFSTLLTIGFGDIVPSSDLSQSLASLEGMIGQFYMVILVARLVSLRSLESHLEILMILNERKKQKKQTG